MKVRHLTWSIPVVLGASILVWVLAFRGDRRPASSARAATEGPPAQLDAENDTLLARALELSRTPALSRERLVELYAEGAGNPSALPARKLALAALFAQENLPTRLSSVLAAVEADPTPPAQDPLWQELVAKLGESFQGETLTRGIDLMVAESRPRAKRALVSTFAAIARSERLGELNAEQRTTLGNHLIDLYHSLPDDQKPEVDAALRKAVSDDVADILHGKGLKNDDELAIQRAYNQVRKDAPKAVAEAVNSNGTPLEPSKDYRGDD